MSEELVKKLTGALVIDPNYGKCINLSLDYDDISAAITLIEEQAARIAELERERDEARSIVAEANNSLYGSHSYFTSLQGTGFNKLHLSRAIENIKDDAHESQARLSEAVKVLGPFARKMEWPLFERDAGRQVFCELGGKGSGASFGLEVDDFRSAQSFLISLGEK